MIYGSTGVASTLTELGLIDEYRIFVNPIVLGKGKLMFKGLNNRKTLKLVTTKMFASDLVGLFYHLDKPNCNGIDHKSPLERIRRDLSSN